MNACTVVASKPKNAKAKAPGCTPKKPSYFKMLTAAIQHMNELNGSSRQAILKYICKTYSLDTKKVSPRLNLTIKKAMEDGDLKHGRCWSCYVVSYSTGSGVSTPILFKADARFKLVEKKKATAKSKTKKAGKTMKETAKKPSASSVTKKAAVVQKTSPEKPKNQLKKKADKADSSKTVASPVAARN
jgi:hypothetical protein